MEWFTVANLINCIVVMVAYSIKNELHHIRESIDSAKELACEAKNTALRAHERLDYFMEHRKPH